MRAKKVTSVSVDVRIERVRDLIIREIVAKDSRFKDVFPHSTSEIEVCNNGEILKVTIAKNEYLK